MVTLEGLASLGRGRDQRISRGSPIAGERERAITPSKSIGGRGRRLRVSFLVEGGIRGAPFKEIEKRFVQVAKSLLQRDARHVVQPVHLFLLFQVRQQDAQIFVVEALMVLVLGIGFLAQRPIVDEATASKGLSEDVLLFWRGTHPILESAFLFQPYNIVDMV